ncbi:MAG TPA: radical SAM protein, partial [Thermoanaerobaculia bacterium]
MTVDAGALARGRWTAAAVRALRGPKEAVDPWRPLAVLAERERAAGGGSRRWLTVFLAGAECPFTCVFCDLWRQTLDGPTPPGAVPAQIAAARAWPGLEPPFDGVKLYNASNFFAERAVPAADDAAILAAVEPFGRVLVECHPRWVGRRALAWAEALAARGAVLEVAMGLETIHPRAMPRLGKSLTRQRFEEAAATLLAAGAAVRAFVLVGAPWVPPAETVEWTVATARAAVAAGATHVSLIPVRGGNGALDELARRGEWAPPELVDLEAALDRCLAEMAAPPAPQLVVTADVWDLDRLASCRRCATPRRE